MPKQQKNKTPPVDVIALCNFPYSEDGFTPIHIEKGKRFWLPGGLFNGLRDIKWVEAFDDKKHDEPDPHHVTLIGSDAFQSMIKIAGKFKTLGDIVALSHETSGLTVEEWNAQDQDDIDSHIGEAISTMTFIAMGDGNMAKEADAAKEAAEAAQKAAEAAKVTKEPKDDPKATLETLRVEYAKVVGKPPHHKALAKTLKKAIDKANKAAADKKD